MFPTDIHVTDALPDGILVGRNAQGRLVVGIEFTPNYRLLWGTPDDQDQVLEWYACSAHRRRLIAPLAWQASNYQVRGNA